MNNLIQIQSYLLFTIIIIISSHLYDIQAAGSPLIQVVTENALPLNFQDKGDIEIKGYATELLKEMMKDAGLEYNNRLLPWVRAYKESLRNKNMLIYSIGRTIEREDKFKWVGKIIPMGYDLYGPAKNVTSSVINLETIKNKFIGVPRNDLRHSYLKKLGFTNLIFTSSYDHTYKLLERGRIEYFIASTLGIAAYKKQHKLSHSDLVSVIGFKELKIGLYFAFNPQTSDQLVARLRKSYKNIIANGTFSEIMGPLYTELQLELPLINPHKN